MKTSKFSSAAAPINKPIPLWILYPLFFTAIYLSHYTLLRLPYFWDEAGYYIPAALDFYQTGSLIPHSTLTNAHPPLPSLLLASWWHLAGLVITDTRTFIAAIAAAALLGVYRLARALAGTPIAAAVTTLTAIYPIWFTQSTLAHADIFAAAFTLWALSFYFEAPKNLGAPSIPASPEWVGSPGSDAATARTLTAILFSLAALSKETAIVTPIALAAWELTLFLTEKRRPTYLLALLTPILPLAAWYAYHRHATGFIFGNPEFLRYNATANLTPLRVLLSLYHRIVHLTFHMNLYVPVLCTLAVLFLGKKDPATTNLGAPPLASERWVGAAPILKSIAVIVLGNALAFSILGGALLTRYLLPLYPLVLLLCVATWYQRLPRHWPWLALLTAAAFVTALFVNPPYPFAPEDNLTYRDMIVLHQQAAQIISERYPYATVLTAWPATTELEHPQLGYVPHPIKIVPIDNFAADQIAKAATNPGAYDTALIFSTKWTPTAGLNLARASESNDTRYFDYHRDLTPAEAALALHGDIIWQRAIHGEWAAVLRFPPLQRSPPRSIPLNKPLPTRVPKSALEQKAELMNKFFLFLVLIGATALIFHHKQAPAQAVITEQADTDFTTDEDDCAGDCVAHEAGYHWAAKNEVDDEDTCDAAADHNSTAFVEGCKAYANEDQPSKEDDDTPDDDSTKADDDRV